MFGVAASPVVRLSLRTARRSPQATALDEAVAAEPGPAMIALLARVDPERLDDVDRVRHLQAWEKATRWVAAQHSHAVVAVAGPRAADRDDFARENVRVALVEAGGSPKACVDTARALAGPLREAGAALARGDISEAHARVLAQETSLLPDDAAREVATEVLARSRGRTPAQFRRQVRRAVIKADPDGAEGAAARASRERRVQRTALPDAQAELTVTGPALAITTIWTALDLKAACTSSDDPRTLEQRRFDALVALCAEGDLRTDLHAATTPGTTAGTAGGAPRSRRRRGLVPAVHVYAEAATWAGLAREPVELEGYGPIPAGHAREHLTSSEWRAVVLDALTKRPVAVSDTTYRPSPRTSRLTHLHDRGCLMPGCSAAVWHCDTDHNTPHEEGGCTDPHNCGLLRRRHHRLKTFTDWRWERRRDGTTVWTDPHGGSWPRPPEPYPVAPPPQDPPEGEVPDPPPDAPVDDDPLPF